METHSNAISSVMNKENMMTEEYVCPDQMHPDRNDSLFSILENNSKIRELLVFRLSDTLDVASSGELTYYPFGPNITEHGLQTKFRNIFKVEHQKILDEPGEEAIKFSFKDSFIKTHYNDVKGQIDIVSGIITDKEIFISGGIVVGMTKKEFFSKIFADMTGIDLSQIKIFRNGDYMGEISQEYIFENDRLAKVIFSSDYDWIPQEL